MEQADDFAEESFYVADDEKSITLVDILGEIKDKRLSLQMFMSLLKDLSQIMSVQEEERKNPKGEKKAEIKTKKLGKSINQEDT